MYWLFRLHNILPKKFCEMGDYEKQIVSAFVKKELEEIKKEREG